MEKAKGGLGREIGRGDGIGAWCFFELLLHELHLRLSFGQRLSHFGIFHFFEGLAQVLQVHALRVVHRGHVFS